MTSTPIQLPAQFDLSVLSQLKDELASAFAARDGVILNATAVERVGTPAIQLLLAAGKEFSADEQPFSLRAPSPALIAAFDDLGLGGQVRKWSAE